MTVSTAWHWYRGAIVASWQVYAPGSPVLIASFRTEAEARRYARLATAGPRGA